MTGRRGGGDSPEGRPPRLPGWILRLLLSRDDAEAILGDLEEEYREVVLPARGRRAARRWYARMVADSIVHRWRRSRSDGLRPRSPAWPSPGVLLDRLWQDARFGLRGLRRYKGLTLAVMATLGVALGANTAMFAAVDGVLLKPLPYPDPAGLVTLWQASDRDPDAQNLVSIPNFRDWRARSRTVASMATVRSTSLTLTGFGDARLVQGAIVSEGFLDVFALPPVLGRGISAEEARVGGPPVVMVSETFWREHLGADPGVLGRTIDLDGTSHVLVGVVPAGFDYPEGAAFWIPEQIDIEQCGRGCVNNEVVGRLARGVPVDAAREEFAGIARAMAAEHGMEGYRINVVPMLDLVVGDVRRVLLLLMGAVGLVLLIACANVAGLLLARARMRADELAVRAALGADRRRLTGQLLVESALMAAGGGVVGLVMARVAIGVLQRGVGDVVPRLDGIGVDGSVLLFTGGALVAAVVLMGLGPALVASRASLANRMRGSAGRGATGRSRGRATLVATQVALSVVLVLGAALLLRTVVEVRSVPLGFEARDVHVVSFFLPPGRVPDSREVIRLHEAYGRALAALPGVESVGAAFGAPLSDIDVFSSVKVEGWAEADAPPAAGVRTVTPGYFETLGISLVSGRLPESGDRVGAPRVVWVNRTAARTWWPGGDPLGRVIDLSASVALPESEPRTVVGVVEDTRFYGPRRRAPLEVYIPHAQNGSRSLEYFYRLRPGAPTPLASAREALRRLDASVPLEDEGPLEARVARAGADARLWTALLGTFTVLALGLAAVGLFGVVAHQVSVRRREIGIRMAVGARSERVVRRMVAEGLRPGLTGLGAGLLLSILAVRLVKELLFGVTPSDALAWVGSTAVLLVVVVLAGLLPALRATRVSPAESLRTE